MTSQNTIEPYSGNFIEGLLDVVDRILLPYSECDGHDFYMSEPFPCQNRPTVEISGQHFCVKHMSQAWEPEVDHETRLR